MRTTDDYVIERLRTPPARTASVTGLISQYLPEIQAARRIGKTWIMIGRDLQPENPIKADTVRRTVERATKGRAKKARGVRQPTAIKPTPPPATQPQLALQEPPVRHNPFGRKVDPIRNN